MCRLLDNLPVATLLINQERQIVHGNHTSAVLTNTTSEELIGRRLGEAVACVHHDELPGGCGTTDFCMTCGAHRALLNSFAGRAASEECRIRAKTLGKDLDLRVWSKPVVIEDETFTQLTLMDIRDEKRRAALERIFFHDILNTAGSVRGLATLLADDETDEAGEMLETLEHVAEQLIEEIEAQRDLLVMEQGVLDVRWERVSSRQVLEAAIDAYGRHESAASKTLGLAPDSMALDFISDSRLLRRVIGNLTKNALEASPAGATVTLSCDSGAGRVQFRVHNPSVMPLDVQRQLFQRSFSTKGPGRGVGTYSIKLLTEGYLAGHVSFVSTAPSGTTFTIDVPREPPGTSLEGTGCSER
jgi:signal transduction histidine kinase